MKVVSYSPAEDIYMILSCLILLPQNTAERVQALILLASKLGVSGESLQASGSLMRRESKADIESGRVQILVKNSQVGSSVSRPFTSTFLP